MRLVLLGGSGRTGRRIIDEALSRGHRITALVRSPQKIPCQPHLTKVQGTPLNCADVDKAFQIGADALPGAVIVALNPCRRTDSPFSKPVAPPRLLADSVANTIKSMKEHGLRKIVVMQAMGVGDSFPNLSVMMKWVSLHTYMAASYADHNLVDQEIRKSGLDYVLARPPWLTNGKRRAVKIFGDQGEGIGGLATISRDSVASFLVDAAEQSHWDRTTPVIASQ